MKSITSTFKTAAITAALFCQANVLSAAPLPDGTVLLLEPGANPDATGECTTGSCFGVEVSPDFWIWTMIEPGNDGGFVVGENQLSGGQETALSAGNTTAADISAAWFYFDAFGTFFADNTLNTFSDTSNDGVTVLGDFNIAWNGNVIPIGRGRVNDYRITLDDAGGGRWSMEYLQSLRSFTTSTLRLLVRGDVTVPIATNNNPPVVNDVNLFAMPGRTSDWFPNFTDDASDTHTCEITSPASNGIVLLSPDCSIGTYTAEQSLIAEDSFSYTVTDQSGLSGTANVNVRILDPTPNYICEDAHPLRMVTTVGGGQNPDVNATVSTTFIGPLIDDFNLGSGSRNSVNICPFSKVYFESISTLGSVHCRINGVATASKGLLFVGDKLICSNKPDGNDTDRFMINTGVWD